MPAIELSADDRATMTPAEIEALTGADAEAHLNLIGDEPQPVKAVVQPAVDEGAAALEEATGKAAPAATGDGPTLEELEALLEALPAEDTVETIAPAPRPANPHLRVERKDFDALRTAIDDKIDAIETKWGNGELSDPDRVKELRALRTETSALDREQARADTLAELNAQQTEQTFTEAAAAIADAARASGTIDYGGADRTNAELFDKHMNALIDDPLYADKTPTQIIAAAHRVVLAILGLTEKAAPAAATTVAAPAAAAAPAAPAAPRAVVTTLSGLPNAMVHDVDTEADALAPLQQLQGEELEEWMARQPAGNVSKLMRVADSTAMGFAKGQGSRRNQARSDEAEAADSQRRSAA